MRSLKKLSRALVTGAINARLTDSQFQELLDEITKEVDSKSYFFNLCSEYWWDEKRKENACGYHKIGS